jgi:hypothetical protein
VDNPLTCSVCGWHEEAPPYRDIMAAPGLYVRENKPRPFDNTKIDCRILARSSSSLLCVGVYPEGTTQAQVRERVNGTFGGRFEQFGNGTFRFIAYTD